MQRRALRRLSTALEATWGGVGGSPMKEEQGKLPGENYDPTSSSRFRPANR